MYVKMLSGTPKILTYSSQLFHSTLRYMSAEVANGKPYNALSDCYSFAILLWAIMALEKPFELYTSKLMFEKVFNGPHERPKIDESWSEAIKMLLKQTWSVNLHSRNTMAEMRHLL